jgi:hypothetical protein
LARNSGVEIAIVHDAAFPGKGIGSLPPSWVKVAQWQVPDKITVGDRLVTFYAVDPAAREKLATDLRAFAPQLPPDVKAIDLSAGR